MVQDRSEQEEVRREKLAALREAGVAYPNDTAVDSLCEEVLAAADEQSRLEESARRSYCIAGRLVSIRVMGKAAFCHIQDRSSRLQIYLRRDDVGVEVFNSFKKFDLGDIVEVKGFAFLTKTGEESLHASSIRLLVKSLHPLPEKWHGLTDVEVRYRQRYLDLIANPCVKDAFKTRAQIIRFVRNFFDAKDYVEVETPVMGSLASGAAARPFETYHNSLSMSLYLRIALELPLKKLVVGGLERVYELGRVFRNEGISTEHNPEFTMLEFYQAYATYETLMDLTEELITSLCENVKGGLTLEYRGKTLDFSRPWSRLTMKEAVHVIGEVSREYDLDCIEGIHAAAKSLGFEDVLDIKDYGKALYEIFDRHVESKIVNPTFITQHPTSISPLARKNVSDERFTDRFELMVAGMELANAFSELNDPEDQRQRFEAQLIAKQAGDDEAMALDEDFIRALEFGLPPTAGEGIGIDRLVMLLTDAASIRDVILFPTLRPQRAADDLAPEK